MGSQGTTVASVAVTRCHSFPKEKKPTASVWIMIHKHIK